MVLFLIEDDFGCRIGWEDDKSIVVVVVVEMRNVRGCCMDVRLSGEMKSDSRRMESDAEIRRKHKGSDRVVEIIIVDRVVDGGGFDIQIWVHGGWNDNSSKK